MAANEEQVDKIEGRAETEVYVNPHGNVVIKQDDPSGIFGEPPFVWIHPDDIDQLIALLVKNREEAYMSREQLRQEREEAA